MWLCCCQRFDLKLSNTQEHVCVLLKWTPRHRAAHIHFSSQTVAHKHHPLLNMHPHHTPTNTHTDRLASDPLLSGVSHVVVDEVHERRYVCVVFVWVVFQGCQ